MKKKPLKKKPWPVRGEQTHRPSEKIIAPEFYPSEDVKQLDEALQEAEQFFSDAGQNLQELWDTSVAWKGVFPLEPQYPTRGRSLGAGAGDDLYSLVQIPSTPSTDRGQQFLEQFLTSFGTDAINETKTRQATLSGQLRRLFTKGQTDIWTETRAEQKRRAALGIEEIRDIIPIPSEVFDEPDIPEGGAGGRPPERPITRLERLFGKEPTTKITDRFPGKRQTCEEIEKNLRRLGFEGSLCHERRGVRIIGKT